MRYLLTFHYVDQCGRKRSFDYHSNVKSRIERKIRKLSFLGMHHTAFDLLTMEEI